MIAKEVHADAHCVNENDGKIVGIVFRPHKPSQLIDKAIDTLQCAAKQCDSSRPALLWLHLVGMPQEMFIRAAIESSRNPQTHFNRIAHEVFHHHKTREPDRIHVERVRITGEPEGFAEKLGIAPDLMLRRMKAIDGKFYDVQNPGCAFPLLGPEDV